MTVARWSHAIAVCGARGAGQDRASVVELVDGLVIALADGAGGTGGGDRAAQAIVDAAVAIARRPDDRAAWPSWATVIDTLDREPRRLGFGEATAVLLTVTASEIAGASVGDSGAWLIAADAIEDLTAGQRRKPLVGGGATPTPFSSRLIDGATRLVASDGLLKYAPRAELARLAGMTDLATAAAVLVALVRLPTGGLQDDVAVVLCRRTSA